MDAIKKIGAFFALFAIIIGAVTSLVLTAQQSLWVAFAGQILVLAGAVPSIVTRFNFLRSRPVTIRHALPLPKRWGFFFATFS